MTACLAAAPAPRAAEPIEKRIDAQRQVIESTQAEREAARQALAEQKERLAFLEAKTKEIASEQQDLEAQQRRLSEREARLREELARRRAELEAHLRAAYPLTRGSALRTLLGEGDALQSERDLHYLRELIRPVREAQRALKDKQVEVRENRAALAATERQLATAGDRLDEHYRDLRDNLEEQSRLLATLGKTLDEQQQALKSMLERKRRLDREVAAARAEEARREARRAKQAEQAEQAAPPVRKATTEIVTSGIPVVGSIQRRFGERQPQGKLRTEGVEFRAPAGTPVHAIAPGTVAYAGPLKGWGNLIMLRHADDYLSLYAHCRSLAVSKGQRVARGQTVCQSGVIDANREGLYVEVRRGNRPIDPTRWPAWGRAVDG
ncbi:MAG: peptidoglycan DD-metalloendopeptidase family protein [Halothiobacillaceae bacterium]|nr:peptidoglycan DD-metalloendopeptidase family protein [Halothiobacillaceae bacterium]